MYKYSRDVLSKKASNVETTLQNTRLLTPGLHSCFKDFRSANLREFFGKILKHSCLLRYDFSLTSRQYPVLLVSFFLIWSQFLKLRHC